MAVPEKLKFLRAYELQIVGKSLTKSSNEKYFQRKNFFSFSLANLSNNEPEREKQHEAIVISCTN